MIGLSLAGILGALKTLLGIAQTGREIVEVVDDAVELVRGDEPGAPLTSRDVTHQQNQIRSAARPFPLRPPRR